MKPIHDREFGRQTRRAQTRFLIGALHPPAGEVRGARGSPVRGGWAGKVTVDSLLQPWPDPVADGGSRP